jgi:hypothetical protein
MIILRIDRRYANFGQIWSIRMHEEKHSCLPVQGINSKIPLKITLLVIIEIILIVGSFSVTYMKGATFSFSLPIEG